MMIRFVFVGSKLFTISIKCCREIKKFSARNIFRLNDKLYRNIWKGNDFVTRSVKYYLRQNNKESCIQEATVIIGPHDLVNKCWPNIKYANKIYFSRLNILVDQISYPIIWTHSWKFLTSFSFIYYFFQIFFFKVDISKSCKKDRIFFRKNDFLIDGS